MAYPNHGRAKGFTLVEVLVAVLVLSIGLLGIAGLQLTSLRGNQSSYLRSQATVLSYDLIDRMRANRSQAMSGSYDINYTTGDSMPSGSTMADADLTDWLNRINSVFPGTSQASVNMDGNNVVSVTIQWNDSRADSTRGRDATSMKDSAGNAMDTSTQQFSYTTEF
jgi:type IV pilus assembly protein PilV